ncbi:TOM1L2 isoform 11, partial [Pan troglodytes]
DMFAQTRGNSLAEQRKTHHPAWPLIHRRSLEAGGCSHAG